MTHLYVCRHGESTLNAQHIYAGQLDTPLTDLGREQAAAAGNNAGELPPIDCIVASPLVRALETAQIIAAKHNYPPDRIITSPLMMERSYGSLQGQPWSVTPDPKVFLDIETPQALTARAQAALDFLRGLPAQNILLVSHGSFLLALSSLVLAEPQKTELFNAQIVQLV
jgi:broad specificity phosphatase PhoE